MKRKIYVDLDIANRSLIRVVCIITSPQNNYYQDYLKCREGRPT